MSSPVEEIKRRIKIEELISSYITIERAGSNFKAKCPFHNERTPSFFISPDRGSYYCFGCGAKGDIFSFVQSFEGLDFMGALKILADKSGVVLELKSFDGHKGKDRLMKIMEAATVFYEKFLEKNPEVIEYLKARGLTDETIKKFRIGFAPYDWRTFYNLMSDKGATKDELIRAGLVKIGDKDTVYDRFRGRIMFPIADSIGRTIAFTGRVFKGDETQAKYINSPETELFKKSEVLYGLDKAKRALRIKNRAIMVEGQMDLIMCHQSGIDESIATSGTAVTEDHLQIIKRYTNNLLVSFDNDKAGRKASERLWFMALKDGFNVEALVIPNGKDPADALLQDKNALDDSIKSPKHLIEALLEALFNEYKDKELLRKAIISDILPLISAIPQALERGRFVSIIASKMGVKEDVVWEDIKKQKSPNPVKGTANKESTLVKRSRYDMLMEHTWALLYYLEANDPEALQIYQRRIKDILGEEVFATLIENNKDRKHELMFQAEVYWEGKDKKQIAEDLSLELEIETLKAKLSSLMEELHKIEKDDPAKAKDLLLICQAHSSKLESLKSGQRK